MLLDAAANGLGVALARRVLAESELRNGRLLRLFDVSVIDPYSYYYVWRADHPRIDAIQRVRGWLLRQVSA